MLQRGDGGDVMMEDGDGGDVMMEDGDGGAGLMHDGDGGDGMMEDGDGGDGMMHDGDGGVGMMEDGDGGDGIKLSRTRMMHERKTGNPDPDNRCPAGCLHFSSRYMLPMHQFHEKDPAAAGSSLPQSVRYERFPQVSL